MPLLLQPLPGGVAFAVKVVPNSRQQRIVGSYGEALKLAVAVPPERGKANAAVCALLAEALGIAADAVRITRGSQSPHKQVFVAGLDAAAVRARLGVD